MAKGKNQIRQGKGLALMTSRRSRLDKSKGPTSQEHTVDDRVIYFRALFGKQGNQPLQDFLLRVREYQKHHQGHMQEPDLVVSQEVSPETVKWIIAANREANSQHQEIMLHILTYRYSIETYKAYNEAIDTAKDPQSRLSRDMQGRHSET